MDADVPIVVTRDLINELRLSGRSIEAEKLLMSWRSNNKKNKEQLIKEEDGRIRKIRRFLDTEYKEKKTSKITLAKSKKEKAREYYLANKEKARARYKKYYDSNKEKIRERNRESYHRKKGEQEIIQMSDAEREKQLAEMVVKRKLYHKAYYHLHKEKKIAYQKAYKTRQRRQRRDVIEQEILLLLETLQMSDEEREQRLGAMVVKLEAS